MTLLSHWLEMTCLSMSVKHWGAVELTFTLALVFRVIGTATAVKVREQQFPGPTYARIH